MQRQRHDANLNTSDAAGANGTDEGVSKGHCLWSVVWDRNQPRKET
jgi:hypothetical protein